jgi:hypothetical protein
MIAGQTLRITQVLSLLLSQFIFYRNTSGLCPETHELLKKFDQNFKREKSEIFHHIKVFGVTFLEKGNKK